MEDRNNSKVFSDNLIDYHFRFVILLNCFLFLFYTLLRIYMAAQLVFVEKLNFFTGHLFANEPGYPHYTLFRVFVPIFLLIIFFFIYFGLFKEKASREVKGAFRNIVRFERRGLSSYLIFLVLSFAFLSFIPGFALLVKNLNTLYPCVDINSYISLVVPSYNGDYNTTTVPEGGFQFVKYYILTVPVLLLTFVLGLSQVAFSYNVAITLLVFFTILNIAFTFRSFFFSKKDRLFDEIILLLFVGIFVVLSLGLVIFRSYFGYNAITYTYSHGFYGALGASYLFTCILFILSYFLRKGDVGSKDIILLLLFTALFSAMLGQSYLHFILPLFPSSGIILAVLLSRKTSWSETAKLAVMFLTYLILNFGSFFALQLLPEYGVNPIRNLSIISVGLIFVFVVLLALNKWLDDLALKVFFKFRYLFFLTSFFIPFLWYILVSGDVEKVELLNHPIKLGNGRVCLLVLFLCCLILSLLAFRILKLFFLRERRNYFVYGLICGTFLLSLFVTRTYGMGRNLPPVYPEVYPEEDRILDRTNPYAFDEEGYRVTYNEYFVDIANYFVRENVKDMCYWIVVQGPSSSFHEHGLLQRLLALRDHRVEGITIRDFGSSEDELRARIPVWAKLKIKDIVVDDYDSFARYIFDIEKETRRIDERCKNRYVILDSVFPEEILYKMDESPLFHKTYENKLYKVYKMKGSD